MTQYDYIIAGAGCAGRSLAIRLLQEARLSDKRILLVDNSRKKINDKTWCFWEKEGDIFEEIVSCRWSDLIFNGSYGRQLLNIHPYEYKLIRSIDFYAFTDKAITGSNIEVVYGNIDSVYNEKEYAVAVIDGVSITATYIFSSIPYNIPVRSSRYTYLLQHFKGWVIETEGPFFDPGKAVLMDFYSDENAAFFYILPYSDKRALIEYTVFSDHVLNQQQYEEALIDYIETKLGCNTYNIAEVEDGCIPMYDHPFKTADKRIIYLGVAGGNAKASSGYAFRNIQKHTAAIVKLLVDGKYPFYNNNRGRFQWYDSIFLGLLSGNKLSGKEIFSRLFKRNRPAGILKFLDNETSIGDEIGIFSTLQKRFFLMEAVRRLCKHFILK
jgi:lycopene beta-cyclase